MKKIGTILLVALCLVLGLTAFACGSGNGNNGDSPSLPTGNINLVIREGGSGTRDGFEGFVKENGNGQTLATANPFNSNQVEYNAVNSTGLVKANVSTNHSAIGYMSLGSVDSSVKSLIVDGVTPTAETVTDGTYKYQRPFVIMHSTKVEQTALAANFESYLKSAEAQTHVESQGFVKVATNNGTYTPLSSAVAASEKILVMGSTSAEPVVKFLIGKYIEKNTGKIAAVNFEGSTYISSGQGRDAVAADETGNVIGLSSSKLTTGPNGELNQGQAADKEFFNLCLDGIAVVVHKNNSITKVTTAELFDIFTGKIKKFAQSMV